MHRLCYCNYWTLAPPLQVDVKQETRCFDDLTFAEMFAVG